MSAIDKGDISETHIAPKQENPMRLQEYAIGIFKLIATKSALKKAIKKEYIQVDARIGTTATMINGGEIITLHQPKENSNKREFILPLEVIFEDDYLALINKPPGILVSGNSFKTIANALAQNLTKSTQTDAISPKPVHRLDFPTTGILLIGKTTTSVIALNKLFEDKKIDKVYYATTIGKMEKEKTVSTPIDGKTAATDYEIMNSLPSTKFKFLNLVKLKPKTGRRHQLRKHMAALGNPILGDIDYGKEDKILKGKGLYLHAFSLKFVHPITNEKMYFEKELPKKFGKLFTNHVQKSSN